MRRSYVLRSLRANKNSYRNTGTRVLSTRHVSSIIRGFCMRRLISAVYRVKTFSNAMILQKPQSLLSMFPSFPRSCKSRTLGSAAEPSTHTYWTKIPPLELVDSAVLRLLPLVGHQQLVEGVSYVVDRI